MQLEGKIVHLAEKNASMVKEVHASMVKGVHVRDKVQLQAAEQLQGEN